MYALVYAEQEGAAPALFAPLFTSGDAGTHDEKSARGRDTYVHKASAHKQRERGTKNLRDTNAYTKKKLTMKKRECVIAFDQNKTTPRVQETHT